MRKKMNEVRREMNEENIIRENKHKKYQKTNKKLQHNRFE